MSKRIVVETDTSPRGIYNLLCDGMHDIVVKCSVILADCYLPEDMVEMRNGQLKLTQKVSYQQKQCFTSNLMKEIIADFLRPFGYEGKRRPKKLPR